MGKEEKPRAPKARETEYTAAELAAASESVFGKGVMPECVLAALRQAGVDRATRKDAKRIVTGFLTKEVK